MNDKECGVGMRVTQIDQENTKQKVRAVKFEANKTDRLKIIKIMRFAHYQQIHKHIHRNRNQIESSRNRIEMEHKSKYATHTRCKMNKTPNYGIRTPLSTKHTINT